MDESLTYFSKDLLKADLKLINVYSIKKCKKQYRGP